MFQIGLAVSHQFHPHTGRIRSREEPEPVWVVVTVPEWWSGPGRTDYERSLHTILSVTY